MADRVSANIPFSSVRARPKLPHLTQ